MIATASQARACPLLSQMQVRKQGVSTEANQVLQLAAPSDSPKPRKRTAEEVRQHQAQEAARTARLDEQERLYLIELPCRCHPAEAENDGSALFPADYPGGLDDLVDSPVWNEAALVLIDVWPWPLHIDFSLVDVDCENLSPFWQILGPDSMLISKVMETWASVSKSLDREDPQLRRSIAGAMPPLPNAVILGLAEAFNKRPGPFTVNHRHKWLHQLADRDGGWRCHYCRCDLVDVCSDLDMTFDAKGRRFLRPGSTKRFPTRDHLVPQSLGGSDVLANLVLACQPCNSRKGAM